MAGNNTVIGVDWAVKLDSLRKQMSEVPGITSKEVKAMTAVLSKEMRAAEAAAKKAAGASKGAWKDSAKGTDAAAASATKAAKALGPAAGVLARIDPTAGAAASSVAALTSSFEAFEAAGVAAMSTAAAAALGILLAAAIPVAGQLVVLAREADEAAAREEFLTSHTHDLDAAMRSLESAQLAAAVATGTLTAAQGKLAGIEDAATNAVDDFRKAQEQERDTANDSYFASEKRLNQLKVLPGFLQVAADYYGGYSSAQQEALWTLDQLDRKERENQDVVVETAGALTTAAKAEEQARLAKDAHAKATTALTDRMRALNAEMDRQADLALANAASFDDAIAKMGELEAADQRAMGTKSEQMALDHRAALAQLADLRDVALQVATEQSARETAEQSFLNASRAENAAYNADLAAYNTALTKTITDNAASSAAKQAAYHDAVTSSAMSAATTAADAIGSIASTMAESYSRTNDQLTSELEDSGSHLTKAQKAELEKRIADNKKHAMVAFDIAQGVAIAAATVTGIESVIHAINDGLSIGGPAGLVLGAAAGVAQGAAVATEIAAIASTPAPSFHSGLAPDEYNAKLKDGEGVLSTQGVATAGGADAVRAMNQGQGGGDTVIYQVLDHKVFASQMVRYNKSSPGTPRSWHRGR